MSFTEISQSVLFAPNARRIAARSPRAIDGVGSESADAAGVGAVGKEMALDWFAFFCANLQTGFGPFVAVYLTSEKWTQTDIGIVLMIGGLVGLVCQVPGGLLVDRARSKPLVAGIAVAAIGLAGLLVALGSAYALILFAWTLHASATCLLTPSITSVSLDLVGHERIGVRLGRNATFASIGNALAAAAMGGFGSYFSNQAVFFVTAALAIPTITALFFLRAGPARAQRRPVAEAIAAAAKAEDAAKLDGAKPEGATWRSLLANRQLLVLAVATGLFTLANASMLPLVGSVLTLRAAQAPAMLIAACIVVPQIMVAVASPFVGRLTQTWGRRPLLIIGLAALPIRGFAFGFINDPYLFVPIQMLDGISASVIGVLVPLVAADATRKHGGYALAQGIIGTAMGVGAAFSPTIAGWLTDHLGSTTAFEGLGLIAVVALVAAVAFMPETRGETGDPIETKTQTS